MIGGDWAGGDGRGGIGSGGVGGWSGGWDGGDWDGGGCGGCGWDGGGDGDGNGDYGGGGGSACGVFGSHSVATSPHLAPLLPVLCILSPKDLQVNSKLEVSSAPEGTKKWYDGTVEEVKYENGKRLLKVRPLSLSGSALQIASVPRSPSSFFGCIGSRTAFGRTGLCQLGYFKTRTMVIWTTRICPIVLLTLVLLF